MCVIARIHTFLHDFIPVDRTLIFFFVLQAPPDVELLRRTTDKLHNRIQGLNAEITRLTEERDLHRERAAENLRQLKIMEKDAQDNFNRKDIYQEKWKSLKERVGVLESKLSKYSAKVKSAREVAADVSVSCTISHRSARIETHFVHHYSYCCRRRTNSESLSGHVQIRTAI